MITLPSSSLRYGSRDKFMIELSFEDEPEPDRATAEERASWGALKIWANGYNLCTHYEDGELRETIHWNWWNLMRWLEANWNPLFHEQALPVSNIAEWAADGMWKINRPETFDRPDGWDAAAEKHTDDWFRRHCLWACRDGGLLPNIAIRRLLDRAEVSWTSHTPPGAPDHFRFQLTSGGIRLPVAEVAEPLYQFLIHSAAYVKSASRTSLSSRFSERVAALYSKEQSVSRLSWLAGFGKRSRQYIECFRERLEAETGKLRADAAQWFFPEQTQGLFLSGHCKGALMFGSVAPALNDDDRLTIAALMINHRTPAAKASKLTEFIDKLELQIDQNENPPWSQGYELAHAWIEVCGLNDAAPLDIVDHLNFLGITVHEVNLSDKNTTGVALALEGRAPLVLLNLSSAKHTDFAGGEYQTGKRFTLAHELCHLLIDRSFGTELALISGSWAPKAIEQRANAFAAALLMPNKLIKKIYIKYRTDLRSGNYQRLVEAARLLEVSPDALSYHLFNLDFIGPVERDALRAQMSRARVDEVEMDQGIAGAG